VHYGMREVAQILVLAGARASLLRQGVTGLHSAPCLRALLQALPTLLQEQYQYEKPLVVSGEQLLHSCHLKCLAALILVLRLDKVLCYQPVPPNHDECFSVGKLHDCDNYRNIYCQSPACLKICLWSCLKW
jgi:E3 ubiquitin-protein ligase HERC1